MRLGQLSCTPIALQQLCDFKEVAAGLVVYRFSRSKLLGVLQRKVARLANASTFDSFPTLRRGLAKVDLGDDTGADEKLREAGRTQSACGIISQYLPPDIKGTLLESYDFASLNTHLDKIREEEQQTVVSPIPTNSKAKPARDDDGDSSRNGKKRKTAAQASRGVEKLKKVNTEGMQKLSKFFVKKTAK